MALVGGTLVFLAIRKCGAELLSDSATRPYTSLVFWIGMMLFSTALMIWAITRGGSKNPFAWVLRTRVLRGLGRISYGLYLYHLPVFAYFKIYGRPEFQPPSGAEMGLAIAASIAVATLSYFLIERPLLRYAHRFRTPSRQRAEERALDTPAQLADRSGGLNS